MASNDRKRPPKARPKAKPKPSRTTPSKPTVPRSPGTSVEKHYGEKAPTTKPKRDPGEGETYGQGRRKK